MAVLLQVAVFECKPFVVVKAAVLEWPFKCLVFCSKEFFTLTLVCGGEDEDNDVDLPFCWGLEFPFKIKPFGGKLFKVLGFFKSFAGGFALIPGFISLDFLVFS